MEPDGSGTASRHPHPTSEELAAYLDSDLPLADRARVEAHLADCDECRAEVIATSRQIRGASRHKRYLRVASAAAAAAVLLLLWPRNAEKPVESPTYREHVVTTSIAPAPIAPRGVSAAARMLVWRGVPNADRYRVTIFDSVGHVLWEKQTSDTSATLPETTRVKDATRYFWKVEARTGWNRWVASDLVEFVVRKLRE